MWKIINIIINVYHRNELSSGSFIEELNHISRDKGSVGRTSGWFASYWTDNFVLIPTLHEKLRSQPEDNTKRHEILTQTRSY